MLPSSPATESENESDMPIPFDTAEVVAICQAANIPFTRDHAVIAGAVGGMRTRINEFVDSAYRHTKGLFESIPLSDAQIDAMIDGLMKRAGARRNNSRT